MALSTVACAEDPMIKLRFLRFTPCLLCLAVLLLSSCASAPPPRPKSIALRDYGYTQTYGRWLIEREMKDKRITGLSITLVDDQQSIWSEGFGFANEAIKVPVVADTVFEVGSVSKLFTATAVMQLVEQGKVDLDHPLQDYIPEFSVKSRFPDAPPITVRMLLTHHSGLPFDHWAGWAYGSTPPAGYEDDFMALAEQIKDDYLVARPGDIFSYSNLGFSLLGAVVARVSGQAFISYMASSVLAPIGMESSSFGTPDGVHKKLSHGYSHGIEIPPLYTRDLPAGGLSTSAVDLARFIRMVLAEGRSGASQVLQPETLREMLRRQNEGVLLDGDRQFGLGWGITPAQPGSTSFKRSVGHGGASPPFYAMVLVLPEEKLGVAVLTNSNGGETVSGRVAREVLKHAWEAKTGATYAEAEAPERIELPAGKLDALTGVYASSLGVFDIVRSGASLEARLPGKTLNLVPCADGSFETEYRLLGIPVSGSALKHQRFVFREVQGRTIFEILVGASILASGERMKGAPLTEIWKKRLGRYEVTNPGAFPWLRGMSLFYDKRTGLLMADVPGFSARTIAPLWAVTDSEAVLMGFGPGAGETYEFKEANGEEHLMYSGHDLRRIP